MVNIGRTYEKLEKMNLEISQIIDETIGKYKGKGLKFFKSKNDANPSIPSNWIYGDKKRCCLVFKGDPLGDYGMSKARGKTYDENIAKFLVLDNKYYNWAMDVSKKVEKKLGLEVILEKLY